MKTPKLKRINLLKIKETKDGRCIHPNIKCLRKHYMICYDGSLYVGVFTEQWYGLNFNGAYDSGVQLNDDNITDIWEIVK